MTEHQLRCNIQKRYQEISSKWMHFHLHLLIVDILISMVVEIAMFFIISKSGQLTYSVSGYWIKFVIVPIVLNMCIAIAGYIILKSDKFSTVRKQYAISLLFVACTFVLSIIHSGFVAIMVSGILSILMAVMYENQKLVLRVTIATIISQSIGGYLIFWDPDKVLNSSYIINMVVIQLCTLCTWFACHMMINFMKMKRKINAANDMERYQLQRQINIDGLTNVGNKLALENSLVDVGASSKQECYLVMIDIDNFKRINDTYGHVYGDEVLRHMGEALLNVHGNSNVFRYGGDEFCILFYDEALDTIYNEVRKIQESLRVCMQSETNTTNIYSSAGISRYSDSRSVTEFLHQADVAMYESKKQMRSKITIYKK